MNGFFILLIVGVVVYMLFSRKGGTGMGCCGGHHDHHPIDADHEDPEDHPSSSSKPEGNIIDLKKEDYSVISSHDQRAHRGA